MAGIWDELARQPSPNPEADKSKPAEPQGSVWDELSKKSLTPDVPEKRGALGALKDYGIEFGSAALSLPKAGFDFFSPGSEAGANVGKAIDYLESGKSQYLKGEQAKLAKSMDSEDLGEQAKGALQYAINNPGAAAAQAIGSFIGPGAAIKGGKLAAGALNLSEKATGRVALGSGMATTGVLAGGDAAGDAYQMVMDSPNLANTPIAERERMATDAARKASIVPFAIGAASGMFGAEKALATGTKSLLKTGAQEFVSEAIEEGGTKLSANLSAQQYAPEVKTMSGVVGSAVLGGVLGGGTGLAVGALTKQPNSLLPGSTNISTGEASPDDNAMNKAIDANSTEIDTNTTQQVQAIRQQEDQLEQARVQAQQQVQQESVQVAQQQAQEQAAQAEQDFKYKSAVYGIAPTTGADQFRIGNKQFFNTAQAQQFIQGMEELNQGLGDELKFMIGAAVNSGALKIDQKATPKSVNNAAVKFLADYGLADATGVDDAVGRVDSIIQTLEGPKALKEADVLNNFYKSITGTDSPAFVSLQQLAAETPKKGASNEQLQNNARVRAVSEQGGTTQASGTGTGDVRPTSVQSVQSGSVGAGSLGLQTGAVPSQGVSTGGGASASGISVSSTGTQAQGQVNEAQLTGTDQEGRGGLSDQAVERNRTPEQQAEEVATNLVESVIKGVINAVVVRKGRMSKENLAKLKDFIYYDASQIESQKQGLPGLSKKELAEMFEVSTDVIDGWQNISRNFFEQNRGVIQAQIYKALDENGLTLLELKENVQAKRDQALNDAIILEEGQRAEPTTKDDEQAAKQKVSKDTVAADQDLTEVTDESKLDERDLGAEDSGMSVMAGRKGISVQEQNKPEETVNAQIKKALEQYEQAVISGNEELEATLTKKIDELTVEAKRLNDLIVAKGEAKNAVQKPSTKGVSVRKQAEAGKGVPSKDAKERKPAAESKQAPKESRALTLEEQAAQAWDKGVKNYPEAPKFADLAEEQQKDWISFGPDNWTADDVQTELVKLAKTPKLLSKSAQSFFFDEIESEPGLDRIRNYLEITGIPNALDFVSDWATINDPKAEAGSTESFGGRYKITVNMGLGNEAYIGETARHEIAHAVDMAPHGGVYSAQPEMAIVLKDGVITPLGKVAKELYNLYQTSSRWNEYLAYPFDTNKFKDLNNSVKVELEIFAQAFAVYTDPNAKRLLEREAPITAAYFAEVINDIKSTKALQIQKATTAAERLTRFQNRNAAKRPQADFRIVQGREEAAGTKQLSLSAVPKTIDDIRSKAKSNIDKIPSQIRGPFRAIHDALFNAKETALSVMLTIDVAKLASKYMPSAMDYFEVNNKRSAIESAITEKLDKILVMAQDDLNAADRNTVNRLIEDSTLADKWAFDPNLPGVTDKDIDPALAARFNAIGNPKAKQVIRDVFKFWNETLQQEQEAIRSEIDATFAERLANATETEKKAIEARKKDTLDKFSSILKAKATSPYAPLKRFGPFVVVAKSKEYIAAEKNLDSKWLKDNQADEKHYIVEFAETSSEAEAIYDQLTKLGYDYVEKPFKKSESKDALYSSIDLYKAFTQLKKTITAEKVAASNEEAVELYNKMNELVDELYLTSLSEASARKSELQRKKIAGINRATGTGEARDMLRATFSQGASKAKHIANLKTNDESLKTMIAMQKEAQSNRAEAYPYLNELIAREAQSLQVRERSMLDGVNRMTGDWFLTFSPGFYFQQAAQTYVLSVPWLAGKVDGNYGAAFGAVTAAYKDIMPLVKGSKLREHLDFSKAPKDVREMLEKMVARGAINIGIESELLSHRSIDENVVTSTYNKVTNKLRGGINRIEALNRATAATAAYRLEMAKSGDKAKAEQAAFDVVKETHGLYDGSNTPRLFNKNAFTRSIFQFRRFQIIQLTTLARILKDAVAGGSATEKAIARKQFLFMTGHSLALAGVKGLPLYGLASFAYTLAKAAFGDEDDPKDFEAWLRSHGGLLLARGIPAFMGVDVSGKLGQGNTTSILPYTDIDLTSRGGVEKLVIGAAGPFMGGLMPKMADGVGLMLGGQYYKGLEQVLPNGFGGVMKGARFATEGVTTRRGDLVMSPDEISFADAMMQSLGLPTSKLSERQYLQGQLIKTDQFYNDRATEIKGSYTRAVKEGDNEAKKEAQESWKSLQKSRKESGYTVQPLSTLLKAPQEQKKRERNTVGGVAVTKSNKGFAQRTSEQ